MTHWRELTVKPDTSLLDTLRVIDRGAMQFALVLEGEVLAGMVTDGDVRRALMQGVATSSSVRSVMNTQPIVGLDAERPAQWLQKLRDHRIRYLPIVDAAGCLRRVVTEQTCAEPRANWAVVMAGGLGTRLRPLTERVPKPMIEIGGTPIVELIIRSLTSAGIGHVFLALNYRAEIIVDYFGDGSRWDVRIEYLHEPKRMGTAGALSLLPSLPIDPLLVINGDILTGLDYGGMLDNHGRSGAAATMCVREYATQIPYGVVEVEGDELRGITEKPMLTHLASAGVYALSADALKLIPRTEYFDMPTLFQALIRDGQRVRVHRIDDYWIDVGREDDLERARSQFAKHSL